MGLNFPGLLIHGLIFCLGFATVFGQIPIEPKYLGKLNKTEKEEIMNKCAKTAAKNVGQIQNRIWNGAVADAGQFPYAAYIERYSGGKFTGRCGATLISWRHAVTAQHCVTRLPTSPHVIRFWIGGICRTKDKMYCRDGSDMTELAVRHIAFIRVNFTKKPHEDHAIIELKEQVSKDLQLQGVEFACLPRKNELVPDDLITYGWGSEQPTTKPEKLTAVLRYTYFKKSTRHPRFDACRKEKMVCGESQDEQDRGISFGDSGSGIVDLNGRLHGITQSSGFKPIADKRYISLFVKLEALRKFYCKYLDLCMPRI